MCLVVVVVAAVVVVAVMGGVCVWNKDLYFHLHAYSHKFCIAYHLSRLQCCNIIDELLHT